MNRGWSPSLLPSDRSLNALAGSVAEEFEPYRDLDDLLRRVGLVRIGEWRLITADVELGPTIETAILVGRGRTRGGEGLDVFGSTCWTGDCCCHVIRCVSHGYSPMESRVAFIDYFLAELLIRCQNPSKRIDAVPWRASPLAVVVRGVQRHGDAGSMVGPPVRQSVLSNKPPNDRFER